MIDREGCDVGWWVGGERKESYLSIYLPTYLPVECQCPSFLREAKLAAGHSHLGGWVGGWVGG